MRKLIWLEQIYLLTDLKYFFFIRSLDAIPPEYRTSLRYWPHIFSRAQRCVRTVYVPAPTYICNAGTYTSGCESWGSENITMSANIGGAVVEGREEGGDGMGRVGRKRGGDRGWRYRAQNGWMESISRRVRMCAIIYAVSYPLSPP